MITINQPKVVATTQSYKFLRCVLESTGNVAITFGIFNEAGKRIGTVVQKYSGDASEAYWADFVSKKFMYEKLVEEENLPVVVGDIPDTLTE